jgi:predicted nucleic acid-binding protein
VVIPEEVLAELTGPSTPAEVRTFVLSAPTWLEVRSGPTLPPAPGIHRGEAAAIRMAIDLHADLLLVDDKNGRRIATQMGVAIIGTLGVIEQAAVHGYTELRSATDKLALTDYRIDKRLVEEALERDARRRSDNA